MRVLYVSSLLTVLLPAVALASAASSGHGGAHHSTPTISDLIPYYVNFALYVGLLFFAIRGIASKGWAARRAGIADAVNSGKRATEAAQSELDGAVLKLKQLSQDVSKLNHEIGEQGVHEAAKILADAHETAKRVRAQADSMLIAEAKGRERDIRSEVGQIVLERVKERLSQELTPERDRSLRDAVVGSVRSLVQ